MGNGNSREHEDSFDNEVNLFQFKLMRIIGKGSFGKVRMVERRETGKVYALKYISKAQVIKMEAVRNILRERQILESLDHAFVVNMRFAFQDDEYMYMCMDLMMGGDLRFHMNRRAFGEDVVRFWIAELCSAVSHLHSLGIVHRDIKPDNVLLDEKGHAHLTDFNIGCKLTPEKPILTSQSGTVAYMAPEVFKSTGYGTSVDWWAVGILFYECIYNKRPFQTENIPELRRAIGNQTIEYPHQKGVSQDCVEVIQGFLKRDPNERLGTRGGMNGIRRQPFFQIEAYKCNMRPEQWWYLLETKQLTPVFQPPAEAANFDATYDLEEMLLEDDPLTYRSTRKRALRLHKEKMRAIRAEEERQRAAQEAAEQAEAEAQAAMEAMNRELEKSIRNIRGMSLPPEPRPVTPTHSPAASKKKSKLLFGSGGGDQDTAQPVVQIPPRQLSSNSMTQVSLSSEKSHTESQVARQTQFQSIPLSPIDPTVGGRELPLTPVPAMRFPVSSVGGDQYQPPPPPQNLNPLDHHPSSYYHRPTSPFSKPVVTTAAVTKPGLGNGYTHTTAGPGAGGGGGATAPGVTAVYLPKSTLIPKFGGGGDAYDHDPTTGESGALGPPAAISRESSYEREAQLHQHSFQAAAVPQQAISSPVIIPTPLEHSVSRQKHIPTQQALPPLLRHKSSQQQLPPRRPTTPSPVNIEAAAAAVAAAVAAANMTEEEKFAYQMDIIDREFTTFDYTIFESYHGLVDPVTMSVGDPPEWVRSRDSCN
ncbi:kinase-like domain-containing protein [Linnemannia elongata]|nr:kinase-like domain-containing protein [Linnemannia elongata]